MDRTCSKILRDYNCR